MRTAITKRSAVQPNFLDRLALAISPRWGAERIRQRAASGIVRRHYEGAASGRRTEHWTRSYGDANSVVGPALTLLRAHSRDLVRNNAWARNAMRVVVANTIGWGITAKPVNDGTLSPAELARVAEVWRRWAESTQCDADGRLDFAGLQALATRSIFESGEVLIRRRPRRASDGLEIPMQLQVLEPDFLDTSKDGMIGEAGGPIVHGVEFDMLGRRAAYWLFDTHPGAITRASAVSRRVLADSVAHVFFLERPGQVRGVPWLASAIVTLKDLDEYEDAKLMQAKIQACFAGFVTDMNGSGDPLGEQDASDPLVETLEPGMIRQLAPGQEVTFSQPPVSSDEGFSMRTLRKIAAAIPVTYEDMTNDYSQVNFSSARMSRLRHWQHVNEWRWLMAIPQICDVVWRWAMETAELAEAIPAKPSALWTAPPMPMLEPDREGLALTRLVRGGFMTQDEAIRERGYDPDTFYDEYAGCMSKLDERGIWLDSDVRRTSQAGLTQERAGAGGKGEDEAEDSEG